MNPVRFRYRVEKCREDHEPYSGVPAGPCPVWRIFRTWDRREMPGALSFATAWAEVDRLLTEDARGLPC